MLFKTNREKRYKLLINLKTDFDKKKLNVIRNFRGIIVSKRDNL